MASHPYSYSYGGSHPPPPPDGNFPIPPSLHHQPCLTPQIVSGPPSQRAGYPYPSPYLHHMSQGTLPHLPLGLGRYGQIAGPPPQGPMPFDNSGQREVFTGSVTVTIPSLLVLVVIGINGENVKRIQEKSGAIRIHVHEPPPGADDSLPRTCQIWGVEAATTAAKREIEHIIASNCMPLLIYQIPIYCGLV